MASKPFLDERKLKKALTEQDFRLTPTSKGVRVLAPDGGGTAMIHPSVFTSQQGRRAYHNNIAQLVRIGFDLDRIEEANGKAEEWKTDRVEIEKLIAEQEAESRAKRDEEEAAKLHVADVHAVVSSLSVEQRELWEKIKAKPGRSPRDYAPDPESKDSRIANSRHGVTLINAGLVVGKGQRSARVWYPFDAAPIDAEPALPLKPIDRKHDSRSRSGPVRLRSIEPQDAVVRFKKMGEKATRLKTELEDIIEQMVAQYVDQEEELKKLRAKNNKLESILGRAVDAL